MQGLSLEGLSFRILGFEGLGFARRNMVVRKNKKWGIEIRKRKDMEAIIRLRG